MITDEQLASVMAQINGPFYPRIHAIAARYTKLRLPEGNTLNAQTRIASLFCRACKDFLIRDSADRARQYRADATSLEETLKVLRRDERRFFDSLMFDRNRADRAVMALERMAKRFREIAQDYKKDTGNIAFFYCLGRAFRNLPPPTPTTANAVYMLLIEAMRDIVDATEIKTNYDSRDIRRRLKAGAAAN